MARQYQGRHGPGAMGFPNPFRTSMLPAVRTSFAIGCRMCSAARALIALAALSAGCADAQTVPTGFAVVTVASGLDAPVAFQFLPAARWLYAEQFTGRVRLLRADGVPCAAQDTTSLRGVILRLRTDALPPGPGRAFRDQITPPDNPFVAAADSNQRLIAAYGLRNPFRFQIDRTTGVLVIGDVGENLREEVDLLDAPVLSFDPGVDRGSDRAGRAGRRGAQAGAPLGANFGWPYREGAMLGAHRADCAPEPAGLVPPVHDYDRTQQDGAAVIAAGLYRQVPLGAEDWPNEYTGDLFASDYYSGVLRRLKQQPGGAWLIPPQVPGQSDPVAWGTGFNEVSDWRVGPNGALWFCRQSSGFAPGSGSIGYIAGPGPSGPPPSLPPLELRVLGAPNVGGARFLFPSGVPSPARLALHDLGGRVVRKWSDAEVGGIAPGRFLSWDGRDGDGRSVPPGVYVVRLESAGRTVTARVQLLR